MISTNFGKKSDQLSVEFAKHAGELAASVAWMSAAASGVIPAYRCAHAGYLLLETRDPRNPRVRPRIVTARMGDLVGLKQASRPYAIGLAEATKGAAAGRHYVRPNPLASRRSRRRQRSMSSR